MICFSYLSQNKTNSVEGVKVLTELTDLKEESPVADSSPA